MERNTVGSRGALNHEYCRSESLGWMRILIVLIEYPFFVFLTALGVVAFFLLGSILVVVFGWRNLLSDARESTDSLFWTDS
ncbi:MAG: hypothetical protein A2653_01405 [Candidatus Zambryskibacteria bacterium RIFCSPHIGHO2_01_FULL_43_25]|uniref:Uncharacterized protein n=1 Tax=Candidatus Zambryskibacteria bacterium RIFCSPLOWO2_01_FULL_45_21 TaxID=1802761 RepID=A0A1G2U3V4_9BACT|nr:MAG: hypothetical protein A2653_01405 [Candidatus Zambryskibacteria bacterium RIFCSPHIGHO2_01_FULL_43_25]OHB00388.1 MAG: hypothetical protein A3E94_01635 [Candidatus Zambryskibacteria bacterium RIFCSPHIGHO2_12_FULL_44_12b]OHB04183.1 MAG: hypothetical protein A3B14_02110 [Candidatus Zambryskibacteria bacterium RIFCSPLOWO2_01_FULL_45_21]